MKRSKKTRMTRGLRFAKSPMMMETMVQNSRVHLRTRKETRN